jgi:tRNA nucleotidyltransferase (CCA-adding enzyme)
MGGKLGLLNLGGRESTMQPIRSETVQEERWEHFPHQADIGVRGIGSTKEAAFEQAGLALTAVITDLDSVAPEQEVSIACEAPDHELLLVDWLNALVYEIATRKMLFSRFTVRFNDHCLHATAWGEPIEIARHQPAVEVKGATYTELSVKQDKQGRWIAQCVVDV